MSSNPDRSELSGSLLDQIEETVSLLSTAFGAKFEEAVSDCGGRLDKTLDVIGDYDAVVRPRFHTRLTFLNFTDDSDDSDIAERIVFVERNVFSPGSGNLWGMAVADAVWLVRKLSAKDDDQIFGEIAAFATEPKSFTEADLISVYRGGGTVDRNAPAAVALLAWLKREFGYLKERYSPEHCKDAEQLDLDFET